MITRRHLIGSGVASIALAFAAPWRLKAGQAREQFEIMRTDAEWKTLLTPAQYQVLRHEGTERAFTSPLLNEKRRGTYACAGCNLDLFSSSTKFESHTVGQASGRRLIRPSASPATRRSAWCEKRCIAGGAAAIKAMCLTMVRSPRDCATASTVCR